MKKHGQFKHICKDEIEETIKYVLVQLTDNDHSCHGLINK